MVGRLADRLPMAFDRNIQLKMSLSNTELLRILRDRVPQPFPTKSALRDERNSRSLRRSDVVACFDASAGSVTLSGAIGRRHPFRFTLKPQTKTYENFIRLFLRELQSLSAVDALVESVALGEDAARAVQQLTVHLEAKLLELSDAVRVPVAKKEGSDVAAEFIDVFSSDLELVSDRAVSALEPTVNGARPLVGRIRTREKKFRIVEPNMVAGRHISGFLSLEIEELPEEISEAELQRRRDTAALEAQVFLLGEPSVVVDGRNVVFHAEIEIPAELQPLVECGIHWGQYGANTPWCDEEVSQADTERVGADRVRIQKTIVTGGPGSFGAVVWVGFVHGTARTWLKPDGRDLQFHTDVTASDVEVQGARTRLVEQTTVRSAILRSLESFDTFLAAAPKLINGTMRRLVYRELFRVTSADAALRQLLSEYFQRVVMGLEAHPRGVHRRRLQSAHILLKNLGIGEVVFVSPEGPHAVAGGLAQVIIGLSQALSRKGIATTIISPLYEESQGNKHRAAADILATGVEIHGHRVMLQELGEVRIPFGPVLRAGSHEVVTSPRVCVATVYSAEHNAVRMIFLRHRRLADRLYAGADSDDQLRRALFLSRGALEIVRDPRFGVLPHVLITNDWLSALVPVLLHVDATYRQDPVLQEIETVHLLHNCGRDYQGRFFTNHFGSDLFPLLGIGGEHYFGVSDPADMTMLNLTAGAIFHAGRGIVAVSKPYAEQLLTDEGGECLQHLFRMKSESLFGISNGIDVQALRSIFCEIGERARDELGLPSLPPLRPAAGRRLRQMEQYKAATKAVIQKKYGLSENPEALLITLVGRLTEQKGIQLLSGPPSGETHSVMESLLQRYPEVQLLIGGPPSHGDSAMKEFGSVVESLTERYPGRIRAVFSFIQHRDALEMTLASDLFLMPSRFEPGGITQLEALASGTIVVARRVGGLAATLIDAHQDREHGNSFLFSDFTPEALAYALHRAIAALSDPTRRATLRKEALLAENDWSHRAPKYVGVLQHVVGVLSGRYHYPYLSARRHLLASVKAVV